MAVMNIASLLSSSGGGGSPTVSGFGSGHSYLDTVTVTGNGIIFIYTYWHNSDVRIQVDDAPSRYGNDDSYKVVYVDPFGTDYTNGLLIPFGDHVTITNNDHNQANNWTNYSVIYFE